MYLVAFPGAAIDCSSIMSDIERIIIATYTKKVMEMWPTKNKA